MEKPFLNLHLHHYLTSSYAPDGIHCLGSRCANLIAKYGLNSRHYFNFYQSSNQCEQGLIRERFAEAFRIERAHKELEISAEMETLISNVTTGPLTNPEFSHESDSPNPLHFRLVEKEDAIMGQEKFQQNPDVTATVTDRRSETLSSKVLFFNDEIGSRLRSIIRAFWSNFLPTFKLCSCWDEHCVCLN